MGYALPAPGDVIAGKYVVERTLGRGGMGVVYAVRHRVTGKQLALKCLLPERAENTYIAGRFLREAQAAGHIQHRHVVDVFDVGAEDGLSFIVMELLEGMTLARLFDDTSLTLDAALAIIVRALEGVAAAHAQGILHRDLKPDNIFVCVGPSGQLDDPRVLDFGISKFDGGSGPLTSTGTPMGTPYYMSLEQLRGERSIDVRVDVYAMGVVLYEAIAGRPPHVADNVSALAIQVLTGTPASLEVLRPDLPPGLATVVMKAIARDRDDRYASIRDLIDALSSFLTKAAPESVQARTLLRRALPPGSFAGATTVSAQPTPGAEPRAAQQSPSVAPDPERLPEPRARRPLWFASATLLLVAGGVVWYLLHAVGDAPQLPTTTAEPAAAEQAAPSSATGTPITADRPTIVQVSSEIGGGRPSIEAPEPAALPQPAAKTAPKVRRGGKSAAEKPSSAPSAPAPSAVPQSATRTGVVEGRGGEMAVDEF
jgi:eukaryotic-like serine/threonine-protein kinase